MVMGTDNLTYHKVLDKSKPVYLAMDNLYSSGSPTKKDLAVKAGVVAKLRAGGLTVKRDTMGPNKLCQNGYYLKNHGITNCILINLMNGVDPANIKESAKHGSDWGPWAHSNNVDVVLGWYLNAADCCNKDGRGVLRGIYDKTSNRAREGRFYNPDQYMKKNEIIGLCTSSDEKTKSRSDPKALVMAQRILDLFVDMDEETYTKNGYKVTADLTNNTSTSTTTETATTNTDKTLTKKIMETVYRAAYYEKVLTTKTDENGAFQIKQPADMKYKGEYTVNLYYAGDSTHESCNKTITIQKFSGTVLNEEVLHEKITEYYSDGTNNVTKNYGTIPDNIKTKTVTTTYTYKNGVLSDTAVKTVENYKVLEKATETANIINTDTTGTTSSTSTTSVTGKQDPFNTVVPLKADGTPNVENMTHGGKDFVMVNHNNTYNLSKSDYYEVYHRDSKTLQIKDYYTSKYTAFKSQDTDTYNVVERTVWNAIVQSVHRYLVYNNMQEFNSTVKIDFKNHKTWVDGNERDWTGATAYYHWVQDQQNNNSTKYGTCGPTSASMCTQVLYNYVSENKIHDIVGSKPGGDDLFRALKKFNMGGTYTSSSSTMKTYLSGRKPCIHHIPNHYCALMDYNPARTHILAANPAGCYGGYCSGWHTTNTIFNKTAGVGAAISLNYTLSVAEKTQYSTLFDSMGGKWERPANTRVPPKIGTRYGATE